MQVLILLPFHLCQPVQIIVIGGEREREKNVVNLQHVNITYIIYIVY